MDDSCEMAARVCRGKDYSIHAQTAEEADQIIICSNCFISNLIKLHLSRPTWERSFTTFYLSH